MQNITPFLWFEDNAEEAVNFYASVFPDAKILNVTRNPEGAPGPEGAVLVMEFELLGMQFLALNGGPAFKLNEAVSFMIHCDTQQEVDHYWSKLGEGGREMDCGWLTDRFGLTWQITPKALLKFLSDPDKEKSGRAMQAMMTMRKFDIAALQRAFDGK